MTDERAIVIALRSCYLLPGSWEKRFVRSLSGLKEDALLSVKQRQQLWRMVYKYRRQIDKRFQALLKQRQAIPEPILRFEDLLDSQPDDADTRLVYADLLEESGYRDLANAQRWMVERELFPFLLKHPRGFVFDGQFNEETSWTMGPFVQGAFPFELRREVGPWHPSRRACEHDLTKALAAQSALPIPASPS